MFAKHLAALAETLARGPSTVGELLTGTMSRAPWLITFDDGGVSAYTEIADRLEEKNWRGHFLIATGFISRRGFLSSEQIRELRRRGHVIGTHSDSHPLRMAACSWEQLVREWSTSVAKLSDILGEQIEIASVPGGHYSRRVAEAAARAGIKALFTSEPIAQLLGGRLSGVRALHGAAVDIAASGSGLSGGAPRAALAAVLVMEWQEVH